MRITSKNLLNSLINTQAVLTHYGLTIHANNPVPHKNGPRTLISWPNHVSGLTKAVHFGKILQYQTYLETQAYNCLLFDGSVIRASYNLEEDELMQSSFLWYPAPFPFDAETVENFAPLEALELLMSGSGWHREIQLRSPMRFDYDKKRADQDHPASHLHFQTHDCRIFVDRPLCFDRFIKFIFEHFYSEIYSSFDFWLDLDEVELRTTEFRRPENRQCYLGWAN